MKNDNNKNMYQKDCFYCHCDKKNKKDWKSAKCKDCRDTYLRIKEICFKHICTKVIQRELKLKKDYEIRSASQLENYLKENIHKL